MLEYLQNDYFSKQEMKKTNYILDSSALLAYLQGEPKGATVLDILNTSKSPGAAVYLSVVNWTEVIYILARKSNLNTVRERLQDFPENLFKLVEANRQISETAAEFKTAGKIALADCFAAATAKKLGATLITSDLEFQPLKKSLKILWL